MNQPIQGHLPHIYKEKSKGASQAERSYAKLASAAGLFLHIFPQQNGPFPAKTRAIISHANDTFLNAREWKNNDTWNHSLLTKHPL